MAYNRLMLCSSSKHRSLSVPKSQGCPIEAAGFAGHPSARPLQMAQEGGHPPKAGADDFNGEI